MILKVLVFCMYYIGYPAFFVSVLGEVYPALNKILSITEWKEYGLAFVGGLAVLTASIQGLANAFFSIQEKWDKMKVRRQKMKDKNQSNK